MCVIVGKDVDLLVLLVGLGSTHKNVYLFKPGRYNKENNYYRYSANCMKSQIPAKYILFLHAFTGCDTTSAIFNKGKIAACTLLRNNSEL